MPRARAKPPDQVFLEILERGVKDVLRAESSTTAERIAAINAGAKLLMIRNKISENEESTFFR
jgi:hypothetical protein